LDQARQIRRKRVIVIMSVARVLLFALVWAGAQAAWEGPSITNQCISFTVGPGTGCAWMCAHCADALGPSYYFPDGVCAYQSGGCVGNPLAGVTYTCCSSGQSFGQSFGHSFGPLSSQPSQQIGQPSKPSKHCTSNESTSKKSKKSKSK